MTIEPTEEPPLIRLEEVSSTNDELARLAAEGVADGAALVASRQTAGRGRRGHRWLALPGRHLFLSVLHRSRRAPHELSGLTLDIGTAVAEVLARHGADVHLKWPNDLLLADRKVGGILCELIDVDGRPCVIVGLGLNVEDAPLPPELAAATTLAAHAPPDAVDPEALLQDLLPAIRAACRAYEARGAPDVAAWQHRQTGLGRRVRRLADGRVGLAVAIAPDGALLVHWDGDDAPSRFVAGELVPEA